MWDPRQWLCLRIAAFEEIFLFWTWADVGCWEAPTQRCHNSWAQKEQGLSLKNQKNHQNGDLELEENKGLSPLAGLPYVVTVWGRGKSLPRRRTKEQDTEEKQVWMNVVWEKPPWRGKLLSLICLISAMVRQWGLYIFIDIEICL